MSDIKIGDLVQVVRVDSPCDCYLGSIFPFLGFEGSIKFYGWCARCNCSWSEVKSGNDASLQGKTRVGYLPLRWLKRIPPLSELEGEKRDEEITA